MRRVMIVTLTLIAGCSLNPTPPSAPVPHDAMSVAASSDRTWDAAVEVMAARNVPIKTMDRASGFLATDLLAVPAGADSGDYDCGLNLLHKPFPASLASFTLLVRPGANSARASTVRASVRWVYQSAGTQYVDPQTVECSSRGVWESKVEAAIKATAESLATQRR